MRDIIGGVSLYTQGFSFDWYILTKTEQRTETQQGRLSPPLPVRIVTGFVIIANSDSS
jgi:hypothetical protein